VGATLLHGRRSVTRVSGRVAATWVFLRDGTPGVGDGRWRVILLLQGGLVIHTCCSADHMLLRGVLTLATRTLSPGAPQPGSSCCCCTQPIVALHAATHLVGLPRPTGAGS
jgi:hypothetical protein